MKKIKFGKTTAPRSSSGYVDIDASIDFPGQLFVEVKEGDDKVAHMHLSYLQTKMLTRALSAESEKLRKKKSK